MTRAESIAVVVLACFLTACGPGVSDYSEKLSGDYYFHDAGGSQRIVAPKSWSDDTPIIPYTVRFYDWDDSFIVASRRQMATGYPASDRKFVGVPDYWILDVRSTPTVYGTLTWEDYQAQRRTLGISHFVHVHQER